MSDDSDPSDAIGESRRFQLLVDAVTDYAIYMLDPDGRVSSWNSGAQRFKGYTASEILGRHFSTFYTEEDRAQQVPANALRTAATEGRFETEGWRVRKDGGRFWASVVIDPIRDRDGTLVGFAKVTRDLTERRLAQQALEQAREALHQSQKMEAVGQLAGGVAHEFNNLLQVIGTRLELMRRRPPGAAVEADHEVVRRMLGRAQTLTGHLLSVAGRRTTAPTVVSLSAWMPSTIEILRTFLPPGLAIDLAMSADVADVTVDPGEFESALINLAANARDAMPSGGRLRIRVCNEHVASAGPGARDPATSVVVAVTDDGEGIDADVLPKVFEPFFTTKGPGKGSGLGLSQVHGFVRAAGGAVAIESERGRGTTVTLRLPAARIAPQRPPDEPVEPANGSTSASGTLVLVVDDDPDVAESTGAALEHFGYSVCVVDSGAAALERMQIEPRPRGVLSDVAMPGTFDGIALARELRARHPGVPVILYTGYSDQAQQAVAEDLTVLSKPVDPNVLERTLRQALGSARVVPFPRRG